MPFVIRAQNRRQSAQKLPEPNQCERKKSVFCPTFIRRIDIEWIDSRKIFANYVALKLSITT